MARTFLLTLVGVIFVALGVPSAALARKNAWQLVSLSGTYTYHAVNTNPATCSAGRANDDGIVLSRDYSETFKADSFPSHQYAAKYFPVFAGPQTNARGQKAHLVRQTTSSEAYRVFSEAADGSCTQQDASCSAPKQQKTARFMFAVNHPGFRRGSPPQIAWTINPGNGIFDCVPKGSPSDLTGDLLPDDFPDLFKSRATTRQFTRKRASFSIKGSAPVGSTSGFTATITYSAKATLKKVVIPDGCVDTKPQHQFVCTN